MILLTDFNGENLLRDDIGMALLFLVTIVVTVNILKTAIQSYPSLKNKMLALLNKLQRLRSFITSQKQKVLKIKPLPS
jgi:hypothetical protein